MRKKVLCALLIALLLGAWGVPAVRTALAEECKPVAVVGLTSYDELMGDLEYAAELAGQPRISGGLKLAINLFTGGKGPVGLDKSRPMGIAIRLDGEKPDGVAFLPITDLEQLYETFKPMIKDVTELDGGVWKVQGKSNDKPGFVKEGNGWLFISDKAENLADTPDDPAKLLDGMTERYDVAVRLLVDNVPRKHREKLLAKMREDAKKELQRKPHEDEVEYTIRKIVLGKLLETATCAVNNIQDVTLGWSLDREAGNASLELAVTAPAGSKAAKKLAKLGQAKSEFAGFRLPEAAVSAVCVGECPVAGRDRETLDKVIEIIRAKAFKDIEKKEKDADKAQAGKQLIGGLLEVIGETIAEGRVDGGMAVVVDDGVTLAAGRHIAAGEKLEETLGQLVKAVRKEHPEFVEKVLKTDVVEHNGVSFHTISLPIPEHADHREKVIEAVGDPLLIIVGIGPETVYVAAGKQAEKVLRTAIVRSEESASEPVPPMQLSVAVGKIAKAVAVGGKEERERVVAAKIAEALGGGDAKDNVNVSILPIDRGVKLRIEVERGVLTLPGVVRKADQSK